MKNLTLILEPTEAATKMKGGDSVSAWNYRAQAWTEVPEWIEWMDEARINEVWNYATGTYNPTWGTMRVATKEEVIGFMLANPERDWD